MKPGDLKSAVAKLGSVRGKIEDIRRGANSGGNQHLSIAMMKIREELDEAIVSLEAPRKSRRTQLPPVSSAVAEED